MTIRAGFFNSMNGDRKYSAEDFGKLFENIITDGVIKGHGDEFKISLGDQSSLTINVGTGRAWMLNCWAEITEPHSVKLLPPPKTYSRKDIVVIRMDKREPYRIAEIDIKEGREGYSDPDFDSLESNDTVKEYPIGIVWMAPNAPWPLDKNVTSIVGDGDNGAPYAKGVVDPKTTGSLASYVGATTFGSLKSGDFLVAENNDTSRRNPKKVYPMHIVRFGMVEQTNIHNINSIYSGRNLGTSITPAQYSEISKGTFSALGIGDYWTLDDNKYRIAAFDYFYGIGGKIHKNAVYTRANDKVEKHHIVLVPDDPVGLSKFNKTEDVAWGRSSLRTEPSWRLLTYANGFANRVFGDHLLAVPDPVVMGVSNGKVTSLYNAVATISLMNSINVFGSNILGPAGVYNGRESVPLDTSLNMQFPLFRLNREHIGSSDSYWLRDFASNNKTICVGADGIAGSVEPTFDKTGVRPFICIG